MTYTLIERRGQQANLVEFKINTETAQIIERPFNACDRYRTVTIAEARDYYREMQAKGYRPE